MDGQIATPQRQIDALLLPFLQATDEGESQSLLGQLISDHAESLIIQIISSKLRVHFDRYGHSTSEAEEVYGKIKVEVLTRLQKRKANPAEKPIADFHGYVAVIAYHACSQCIRDKFPQRQSLKNKLRRLLKRQQGFAVWKSDGYDLLGGFAKWQVDGWKFVRTQKFQQLYDDPQAFVPSKDVARMNLADLLEAIFNYTGHPIELDELVNIVAALLGIKDQTGREATEEVSDPPDPRPNVADKVEQRLYLKWVWEEIAQLSVHQRAALLLNLRDEKGRGVIILFPAADIATIRQIAGILEIPDEVFAEMWHDLPLKDADIARLLGCTQKQVIGLRNKARERLKRRRRAKGWGT